MSGDVSDRPSALNEIVGSQALSKLLTYFVLSPLEWTHYRELQRRTGLANRSLQMQTRRLGDLHLIRTRKEQGKVFYSMENAHPGWAAIRALLRSFASPLDIYSIALALDGGVEGADAYLTSDSFGRAEMRLVLRGEPANRRDLDETLASAGHLLGHRAFTVEAGSIPLGSRLMGSFRT